MSFSEPGRDDSSLPPVNMVIPDDARELDRDVLAYRRELRARRRQQRLLRLFKPFRAHDPGGHATIIPLIAACLAIALVGGALLSVVTMSPASAPTLSSPQASAQPTVSPSSPSKLPTGTVQLNGQREPVRSLVTSTIAIIPANCGCGTALSRLATESVAAHVGLYFAGTGATIPQLPSLTARYGDGAALAVADDDGVLSSAYHPAGLTVLLVFKDATADVVRNLSGDFQLTSVLRTLNMAGTDRNLG